MNILLKKIKIYQTEILRTNIVWKETNMNKSCFYHLSFNFIVGYDMMRSRIDRISEMVTLLSVPPAASKELLDANYDYHLFTVTETNRSGLIR